MRYRAVVVILALAAFGCASETEGNRRDTMTQRQRDSTLAQTQLPGASGVGKALSAADSAKARQARMDSLARP